MPHLGWHKNLDCSSFHLIQNKIVDKIRATGQNTRFPEQKPPFRRHFFCCSFNNAPGIGGFTRPEIEKYSGLTKIRTRRRAADSTNSTEPIHLVLQHLRESFSLS
ncbi:TPA: hypothetical protein WI075_002079 [Neisseria meningitidis]|uniref:hypothetical protein n=1 Tax=Neisseria meningitidis TaxID=487 RepID=UPI0002DDEC60|nr:hypothetical protein [Neisseria meningitidis]MCV6781229.1 hypothetical protein [Neisseria meningitidis]